MTPELVITMDKFEARFPAGRAHTSAPAPRRWSFAIAAIAFWMAVGGALRAAEPQSVSDNVAVLRNVSYSDTHKACMLDLALPKAPDEQSRPAIIVIHGGGWVEGDKSSFSTVENRVPGNIVDFAARGFVAATVNYRLSGEAPYPAALDDCKAAIAWLRAHAAEYHVDTDRIGAYGNSAGGHLALLLAMCEQPPRVQAAVSDSGPIDLVYGHEHNQLVVVIEKFMGGPPAGERLTRYRRGSPAKYVEQDAKLPPLLLIYGALDEQVDVRTADQFVAALGRTAHNDVTYVRLADAGHCPHSLVRVPYLKGAVEDFFVRVLKPPKSK